MKKSLLKSAFKAKQITLIKKIAHNKHLYEIDQQTFVVSTANATQLTLLNKLGNYNHTPKIYIIANKYFAQQWLTDAKTAVFRDLKPSMIVNYQELQQAKVDDTWLQHIDNLWQKLSPQQQISITKYSYAWPDFKKTISSKTPTEGYLSHGDLHPGNFIADNKQNYLIDWELISIAPKEFDLAMIKQYLNPQDFDSFINDYPKTIDFEVLALYEDLCLYRCALWAINQTHNLKPITNLNIIEYYREQLINNNFTYNETNLAMLAFSALQKVCNNY